jgi:hypothetical protein
VEGEGTSSSPLQPRRSLFSQAEPQLKKLAKAGFPEKNIAGFIDVINEGMMRQDLQPAHRPVH